MVDYSRCPRPESVAYFCDAMLNHDKVSDYIELDAYYYRIKREGMSSIKVLLTNYYTLGYAELRDLIEEYSDCNCIVNMSNWNMYTEQAYVEAKNRCVGLFNMGEFYGALNFERPYEYIRPIDRRDNN